MKLVKFDSFRSQGTLVNQTDDMYRVVVDMSRREFLAFKQWAARQKIKTAEQTPTGRRIVTCPECGSFRIGYWMAHDRYGCYDCPWVEYRPL